VPPPTDSNAHLFSPRSGDVQLKASQHLSQWYVRLIEYGMRIGTVSGTSIIVGLFCLY
jgi:hypothetical protein